MLERDWWQRIKANSPDVHWRRIEHRLGTGVPDLCGLFHSRVAWVELKAKGWDKLPSLGVELEQSLWLRDWHRHGGRAWLWACVDGEVLLVRGDRLHPLITDKGTGQGTWRRAASVTHPLKGMGSESFNLLIEKIFA